MKRKTKLLAVLCTAAMLLSSVNVTAFAEDAAEAAVFTDVPEQLSDFTPDEPTGDFIAVPREGLPDAGTSPLLHSSDQALVYQRMIAQKSKYPEGTHWTNEDNSYVWYDIVYDVEKKVTYSEFTGHGCVAFCMIISDAAFGDAPAYMSTEVNYDTLRVGDILRISNNSHSVIILEKSSTGVVIAEGNYNSSVHWGRTLTKAEVVKADYYITRYDPNDKPSPSGTNVDINETNFPDDLFRKYISDTIDTDHDESLSASEIAAVTELNIENSGIKDMSGIGFFTKLRDLKCSFNYGLEKFDISKNTALTSLECAACDLADLDVSKNTALTYLNCYGNEITSLDLTKNKALTSLRIDNNNIEEIDVSKCTALETFICNGNKLKTLDVTKNTHLKELNVGFNDLTEINITKNTELQQFTCDFNDLTKLDLSKNIELANLSCGDNKIKNLDIRKNIALSELTCGRNMLTSLDFSENPDLYIVSSDQNSYYIGNVSTYQLTDLPGFDPAKASNWVGATFDGKDTITITDTTVTYDYFCGNEHTAYFTLIAEDPEDSVLEVGAGKKYATIAEAVAKINSDVKKGTAYERYTIKMPDRHTEPKAVTLPDVEISIRADIKSQLIIPSITAKNDFELERLTVVNAKKKPSAITVKGDFTASYCNLGAIKAGGYVKITDSTIDGAVSLSSKNDSAVFKNCLINGKLTSTCPLLIEDCKEIGDIATKGALDLKGSDILCGNITITATDLQSNIQGLESCGKITCSNDLEIWDCKKIVSVTAKKALIMGNVNSIGAITASSKEGTAVLDNIKSDAKVTVASNIEINNSEIRGAVTVKGYAIVTGSKTGALNIQSKTGTAYLTESEVGGAFAAANDAVIVDSNVYGKMTVKGNLNFSGEIQVFGDVSASMLLAATDPTRLSCTSLSVTKTGVSSSGSPFTVRLIKITDKKAFTYEAVKMTPGDKKTNTVAKKFKGTLPDEYIIISPENSTTGKVVVDKGKLVLV